MSTVSMNMLKYIYAKDDFRYYNALCIAENVEDNLSKENDVLIQNMKSSSFNISTLDEYYCVPKVAVLGRYKIDTDKNKLKHRRIMKIYRNLINEKVIIQSI